MKSTRCARQLALLLLAAAISTLCGCTPDQEASLTVWVANDMVSLTDRTQRFDDHVILDPGRGAIRLFAAANEIVSFQLVIDAGPTGTEGVTVSFSTLSGSRGAKIAAGSTKAFRMLPIRVERHPPWYLRLVDAVPTPAGVYDPLVPIDTATGIQRFDLEPQQRLALWVDLHVPRGAAAGSYAGSVVVSSLTHGEWSAKLDLEVFAFVLPDARPVPAVGGFDHRQLFGAFLKRNGKPFDPIYLDRKSPPVRRGLLLMRRLMRLAHAHRLDLFDKQVRPLLKRDGTGDIRLAWDDYDAIVSPYLKGTAFEDGIGCAAWPVPFSQDWPDPDHYGGVGSETYARLAGKLLSACRRHLADGLQAGEQLFLWPSRGGPDGKAYGRHARLAALARKADPNTPILCQLPPAPPPQTGWRVPKGFRELADILAPPCDYLDPAVAAAAARPEHPLRGVWLSPGTPPYLPSLGLIATGPDVRAVPWFAMKYKCTGLFLPEVLHWSSDPFAPVAGAQSRLFYPGTVAGVEAPLPSVRLKRLRRGLQDIAYLWILQKRQRDRLARSQMDALVRYAGLAATGDNYLDPRLDGWAKDGETWILARRILAAEVQAVVSPETADRLRTLAHQVAWRQFHERTRALRVEQVRSFVGPAPDSRTDPPENLAVTVLLELYNGYAGPLKVRGEPANLPKGFRPAGKGGRAVTLPPASRKVIRLSAVGPGPLPTGANGRMPLPLRLSTDRSDPLEVAASVPFLVAGRAAKPPKIDGMLNDWPVRVGNTAQDFRLVGQRGTKGDGLAQRYTMVFVLRDESNLYLAFRCHEPNPAGMVVRPNNLVRYEQLLACREDLVEVLLDPGAKAKGPEDLFHLIVKPNGVLICERGVRTDPPLGRTGAWSARASVAIGTRKDVWTVELSVPLAVFGEGAKASFWRANFTRYATQGAEASSWSGAGRHFYDPRSLGTMFVGRWANSGP